VLLNKVKIYKKQHFTLLELLIAVLILVIVSTVVLGVFRQTLMNYKKGMVYSEISESLAGVCMVMQSDLNGMLPLGDRKSYLEQIRYKIDNDTLKRAVAKFPDEKRNIDNKGIAILDGINEMGFRYIFPKSDDKKKKKGEDKDKKQIITVGDKYVESSDAAEGSSEAKDKQKKKTIKRPLVVEIKGSLEKGNIEKNFVTSFFTAYQKDLSTSTDTDKKDNVQNSDQSGTNDENQQK
jgi:type II secretory pathway component PulJ